MTKFLAVMCVVALTFANQLGNFWFTYGIWPRSWWAYVGFTLSHMLLFTLFDMVRKEK